MRNTEVQSTLATQIPSDTTSVVEAESLKEAKEDPSFQHVAFPVAKGLEKAGLNDEATQSINASLKTMSQSSIQVAESSFFWRQSTHHRAFCKDILVLTP